MQHHKSTHKQMDFGLADMMDKLLFEEIAALPLEEQNVKLRVELEALVCERYEFLQRIQLLESHINKLSDFGSASNLHT